MNKSAVAALTVLTLAACAPESAPPPAAVVTPAPVVEQSAPENQASAPKPEPADPARLAGLTPREVQALVGEPALVRRDDTVQVMLFENRTCVLEVVFYETTPDDYFRAKAVKARNRQGEALDTAACLADILPDGRWRGGRN